MPELDGIAENLRRLRRDIDEQLESTDSSRLVTSELMKKIEDLRARAERSAAEVHGNDERKG